MMMKNGEERTRDEMKESEKGKWIKRGRKIRRKKILRDEE